MTPQALLDLLYSVMRGETPPEALFSGIDEANQYLTRPEYRAPWLLPGVEDV